MPDQSRNKMAVEEGLHEATAAAAVELKFE